MREKLINEILDLAGDEFGREELIQLAKKNNNQLRDMWLYFKEDKRLKNYKIKGLKHYYESKQSIQNSTPNEKVWQFNKRYIYAKAI